MPCSPCCFSRGGVLTRAERTAIARLREQRQAGNVPLAVTHPALHDQRDPLVSFYSSSKRPPRLSARVARRKKPDPRRQHQHQHHRHRPAPHHHHKQQHQPPGGAAAAMLDALKAVALCAAVRNKPVAAAAQTAPAAASGAAAAKTAAAAAAAKPAAAATDGDGRHLDRLLSATKKRLEHVAHRFAPNPPHKRERFVLAQRAHQSDDDRYFSELMRSD